MSARHLRSMGVDAMSRKVVQIELARLEKRRHISPSALWSEGRISDGRVLRLLLRVNGIRARRLIKSHEFPFYSFLYARRILMVLLIHKAGSVTAPKTRSKL